MSIDQAVSTFAGVKMYMSIIIISIIYNDTLAAKIPVSYMTDICYRKATLPIRILGDKI